MSSPAIPCYQDKVDDLYRYVLQNNLEAVGQILRKHPCRANQIYENETLLDYPCRHGKVEMVNLLIQCGVQVNNYNQIGSPPLLYAIVFNNHEIVKILCQNKAKVEGIQVQENLSIIDLTILHGRYESALYIYRVLSDKTLKPVEQYQRLAKKYHLRFVNYPVFIDGIINGKAVDSIDFLTKPIVQIDSDDEEDGICCCSSIFKWWKNGEEKSEKTKEENPESEKRTDRKMIDEKK